MFGLFGSNKSIVGLDIGSNSIKAVELLRRRGEVMVSHVGLEPLASDIVVDSMIVDSGSVASAISKIFAEQAFKAKQVATSVSGHSVIVKKISMQTMDEPELGEAVRNEAAQYIPFDMSDVNVDYQVLSESLDGPTIDVLLVAVKKDKVLNYTNALQLSGRQPAIVDIDAFALQNCYEYNYVSGAERDGCVAEHWRQRDEYQYRAGFGAVVHPRCERRRQPVHRLAAEGTGSEL